MVSRLATTMLTRGGRAAVAAAVLTASLPARADDSAAADALFQQAKTLTEAHRWADACPKFAASYKLDRTLGTLLNLADCEEHIDQTASAWAHFGEAVEMARKSGDKRAEFAASRRAALTPRLPMIQLDVTTGKSALSVHRDGVKIDPAAFGVPLPSDPGAHTITVRRGEAPLVTRTVTARPGEKVAVSLDLEAIDRASPPPAPPAAPSVQRRAGFAVLGVGVGVTAIAGGVGLGALMAKSQSKDPGNCLNGFCTPQGTDALQRARTFANTAQWMGIGGLLVTAVGVTLVVTAPRPPRPAASASITVSPWAGPGGAGLAVGGAL